MIRPWIGLALLAVSWLLGVNYYEPASPWTWAVTVVLGTALLAPAVRGESLLVPARGKATGPRGTAILMLALLAPVAWFTAWPYRAAPLVMMAGLLALLLAPCVARMKAIANACLAGGVILFAQAALLTVHSLVTSRNHDLPEAAADVMAWLCRLVGLEAAAQGPAVVVETIRQIHPLVLTWDMVFDPVTCGFYLGGLILLGMWAYQAVARNPAPESNDADKDSVSWLRMWRCRSLRLTAIVAAWLPLRAVFLLALYLHRAGRSEDALPLHLMNQYFSVWALLGLLTVPALLAWQWATIADCQLNIPKCKLEPNKGSSAEGHAAQSANFKFAVSDLQFAIPFIGALLLALGMHLDPPGSLKQGRVTFIERHSRWSPSESAYDTKRYGGDDEKSASYTYSLLYDYLGQYYDMARVREGDPINDDTLAKSDVLIIKVPTARYSKEEVEAVERFVRAGGGVLLIGDHTNLEKSAATMNDITRNFGFTFRDDVLYSAEPSPDDQHYDACQVPHPALAHVPEFDFAVSCSIDPGLSSGRTLVEGTRLFSMPADYHISNYMPYAQHLPESRFGAFVQAWATRYHAGRAAAWGDSTMFSNFCLFQPNKVELMRGMIDWLNRSGGGIGAWWIVLAGLGMIGLAIGVVQAGRGRLGALLLVAATVCGWIAGCETASAMHRAASAPPKIVRPRPLVIIDRTLSDVPLANGAFNENKQGLGYGLLEQWIPRLGYFTRRASGKEALQGDAIVMICPGKPASKEYRDQLLDYVAGGGRLLVIDAGEENVPSTANQILRPFGLSLLFEQNYTGYLVLVNEWPWLDIARSWEVVGGERVAGLGTFRSVAAVAHYGKGLVIAVGFGNLFKDANMGGEWTHVPNETERLRYEVLYALLRWLVHDEKPVIELPGEKNRETKPPLPATHRLPRPDSRGGGAKQ